MGPVRSCVEDVSKMLGFRSTAEAIDGRYTSKSVRRYRRRRFVICVVSKERDLLYFPKWSDLVEHLMLHSFGNEGVHERSTYMPSKEFHDLIYFRRKKVSLWRFMGTTKQEDEVRVVRATLEYDVRAVC